MRSNRGLRDVTGRNRWQPLLGMLLAAALAPAGAQEPLTEGTARMHASRGALEALAQAAEQAASAATPGSVVQQQQRAEAEAIRTRLREGDFPRKYPRTGAKHPCMRVGDPASWAVFARDP